MIMKKLSTLFLTLGMAIVTTMSATAADFKLGYCHGNNEDAEAITVDVADEETSACIYIAPDLAKTMSGDVLNAVTFYVRNRINVTSCKAWVRETLDGPNVTESAVLGTTSISNNKWNNVALASPYTIGDKGFYIGVTWVQKKACKLVSYLPYPCPEAAWLQTPGKEWTNTEIPGTLCIEGRVSGDKRCGYDAHMVNVKLSKYFMLNQGYVNSNITVFNQGTKQIDGVTFEIGIEGLSPITITSDVEIPADNSVTVPVEIHAPIHSVIPGEYAVNYVKITKLGNSTDEYEGNNEIKNVGTFLVVDKGYKKRVLLEEFTGEKCPNCPPAANLLHQLLELPEYTDCVDAVCHHVGYGSDSFTLSSDEGLSFLYNLPDYGYTFAPAFAIDRVPVESTNSQTGAKYMAPAFFPSPTSLVTNLLDQQKDEIALAYVGIDFETPKEGDTKLNVTFTAERATEILSDNGRLTVYLVEDNVKAINQAGAGSGFIHQHVTRQANSTWGEPIVWDDDNKFTYTFEFSLQDKKGVKYKLEDLRVLAVVNEYNTMKYGTQTIPNCNEALVYNSNYRIVSTGYTPDPGSSGIENNIIDKKATIKAIYDLNGVQHNDFVDGINIVIMSDGTTHKILK